MVLVTTNHLGRRPRLSGRQIPGLALLLVGLVAAPAEAYHTEDDRQTDFSAFTLRRNQVRLGLFQQEYGITNWWTVGTYTLPWMAIPVTGDLNGSVYTKFKLLDLRPWALSFRATYFFLKWSDPPAKQLDDGAFDAHILPLNLTMSYVFDRHWTASFDVTWLYSSARGKAEASGASELLGAGLQQTLQLSAHGELRITRVFALNLLARYVAWYRSARFQSQTELSDGTEIAIDGRLAGDGLRHLWMLQPQMAFSWSRFNLQLGLGYGDVFLPAVRLVSAQKFINLDFDAYFRF